MNGRKITTLKKLKNCHVNMIWGLAILLFLNLTACKTSEEQLAQDTNLAEERIKRYSILKELDDLCSQISKPGEFELVGKKHGLNHVYISHFYRTGSHIYFEEIRTFYDRYFGKNGWDLSSSKGLTGKETLIYRKGNYEISIDESLQPSANYGFSCSNTSAKY